MTQREQDPPEGQVSVCVDYARFTLPDSLGWKAVVDWLRLPGFQTMPKSRYGYRSAEGAGHVTVLHDGNEGMGTCVDITGKGCRELEAEGRVQDYAEFVGDVMGIGGKFSRIDFAIDDREGIIDLDVIQQAAEEGRLSTHFRNWRVEEGWRVVGGGKEGGRTLYFGKRTSSVMVRIYDKAAQEGVPGHWVRVEIEAKDERAQALVEAFHARGMQVVAEYLLALLDFKEQGEHSLRSRWQTAAWWAALLDTTRKLRLRIAGTVQTLEQVKRWLQKQVAPSLAILMMASGGDLDELLRIIEEGRYRVKPWRLARLLPAGIR